MEKDCFISDIIEPDLILKAQKKYYNKKLHDVHNKLYVLAEPIL